jgi:D-tyrosyl-tRNA(Tyr) deacylase
MRLLIQRVNSGKVTVGSKVVGEIGMGLLVLLGIGENDNKTDAEELAEKLTKLRIISDKDGKMNLSIADTKLSLLIVSQFTLYADTHGGNRPSFIKAKEPGEARILYEYFINLLKNFGVNVQTGSFGEYMKISAELDGPVTIIIDSKEII